jgi:phage terminase small subunit
VQSQGSAALLGTGSKGQAIINPLILLTLKLEEKILKLEQELGLTPLARQRLGIAYGEAQMGFKQLQQLLQDDDEKELDDPRLLMLEEE